MISILSASSILLFKSCVKINKDENFRNKLIEAKYGIYLLDNS